MANQTVGTLLILDDDRLFCKTMCSYLADQHYDILTAHSVMEGEKICQRQKIDVVLLDQKLPDGNGIDLCTTILQTNEQVKVIFITAFPSFDNAVKALRNGAYDYLSKPLEIEEVALTVNQAFRTLRLENVEQIQKYKNRKEHDENVLIGVEGGLKDTNKLIQLSAASDVPVLLTGETGTGKNVAAKTIHFLGHSKKGSFIDINCASLPENLIEAELFGYEKGAFTGATSTKKGIFELADGGTLLLDEIGDLPLHLQAKLLGVLDEHKVKRLGGQSYIPVRVKIIAATNIDLDRAVKDKLFRQDLFFRLSVLPIHMVPLRQRKEDILPLCHHFIDTLAKNRNITVNEDQVNKLRDYEWPGNVRELRNIIERSLVFAQHNQIYPADLLTSEKVLYDAQPDQAEEKIPSLAEVEKKHIFAVLERVNHNHTHAATILGVSRSTLLRKLKNFSSEPTVAK